METAERRQRCRQSHCEHGQDRRSLPLGRNEIQRGSPETIAHDSGILARCLQHRVPLDIEWHVEGVDIPRGSADVIV